ncbi:MAG TPA: trehalase family glycosidase, partial [Bacteroidota bacterium]|nr:trehalase family glycosidase [Bacteroidota bacterium]
MSLNRRLKAPLIEYTQRNDRSPVRRAGMWASFTAYGFLLAATAAVCMPWMLFSQQADPTGGPLKDSESSTDTRWGVGVRVNVKQTLQTLIGEEDTDGDLKITIDDIHRTRTKRGDRHFWLTSLDGKKYEVEGFYYLSNLLQELRLAQDAGREVTVLDPQKIFDQPTHRLSSMIRDVCWEGLTRRMDANGLMTILADTKTKTKDGFHYVYVPEADTEAYEYYSQIAGAHADERIRVVKLPHTITPEFSRTLEARHGVLSLDIAIDSSGRPVAVPYVVPGGRFNEMYGWDSYFITLGLLADGKTDLARSMVDQQVYEIMQYGKILNANRTYYLSRSQPPFLTSMARAVYNTMAKNENSRAWLHTVIEAAIREYTNVWMGPDHLTETGLSRYFDTGTGPCPEVEPGHYDDVFTEYAARHHMPMKQFVNAYMHGRVKDRDLDEYFINDRAMRESGHDTSYRLVDRAAHLATVDLNSLLYKIETDLAELIRTEFGGEFHTSLPSNEDSKGEAELTMRSEDFEARAKKRRELINRYLWDEQAGMYFDYDIEKKERTRYLSATTFYPLWAGCASNEQARALLRAALPQLEEAGGLAASSERSRGPITRQRKERQWDFPNGWPPHQILAWHGLMRYGADSIAQRLAYRWLYSMTVNAVQYNGTITEKLNVVTRTHDVFAEYGNVGTKFAYITREGFG